MQPFKRIELVLKYLKISANRLAKEIGLPNDRPQRLYDIKKKGHGISADLASKITNTYPSISYEWLLTGKGEMLVSPGATDAVNDGQLEYQQKPKTTDMISDSLEKRQIRNLLDQVEELKRENERLKAIIDDKKSGGQKAG